MKKLFVFLLFFLCGCSNKVILNCSYVDNSSILGSRKVNDIIKFGNDRIVSYNRNVSFYFRSGIKDSSSIYKTIRLEGRALKKYIGGKYRVSKSGDGINMSFNSRKINNLKYIGVDSSYGYDQVMGVYNELGFVCK